MESVNKGDMYLKAPEVMVNINTDVESGNAVGPTTTSTATIPTECLCKSFCGIVLFGVLASIAIAEVAMVATNEIHCGSPLMSLKTWLIVDAIIGFFCALMITPVVCVAINNMSNVDTDALTCVQFMLWPIGLFHLVWLIIGSIVFWRDCNNLEPKSLNDMMYAVLIIGYIGLYMNMQGNKKN